MILLVLVMALPVASHAADKTVVIPLMGKTGGTGELFLSAPSFRPVTPMLSFSWEENGMILSPNGVGWWIAPLDIPTGVTITSLELFWKNTSQITNKICSVTLNVFNLDTGHGIDLVTMSSTAYPLGVQSVRTNAFKFPITANFKAAVRVYLGDIGKSLIGVKVYYFY
jgi:hypothetical protein